MIDIRKIKTLGKLMFQLETRSKTGSKKKIAFLMISYLLPGCFLPLLLFKQNTDPTGFEFTFLTYLFYSLIISFTLSSELDNLLVTQTEVEIFNSLPVDDRLIVRAKLYMLNRYVMMLTIPLFVPGATYYYMFMHSVPRAVMYFASGFMLCYFLVNMLMLIYASAVKMFKAKKLSTYTLFFQLFLILVMIIGYQLVSYGVTGKQTGTASNYLHIIQKKGLIDLFPQAWYAFLPARGEFEFGFKLFLKVILPLFICYMSYLSVRMYLEANLGAIKDKIAYTGMFSSIPSSAMKRSFFARVIESVYLRNHLERSSFGFMQSMYRQDKAVKLNIIPMIIIPAGLTLFALLTDQLPPPFGKMFLALKPVFHISILLAVLVVINTSVLGMKLSNHPGAAWIYEAYPMNARKQFKNGVRKFYVLYLLVPLTLVIGIILAIKIPLWQAALQAAFIFAAANLYNSFYNLLSRVLPFSKENTLLNSVQKISYMIFPFLYGTLIIMVQMLTYSNYLSAAIALLALITINFWLNFFGFVHVRKSSPA